MFHKQGVTYRKWYKAETYLHVTLSVVYQQQ